MKAARISLLTLSLAATLLALPARAQQPSAPVGAVAPAPAGPVPAPAPTEPVAAPADAAPVAAPAAPTAAPVPYAPYAAPVVALELASDEPMTITMYHAGRGADEERPVLRCRTPCRALVYPAKYRFHVQGGPDKIESDTVADVQSSERLSFSLPDKSAKSGALALAITGTIMIPAGVLVAFASALSNACFDCPSDEARSKETPAGVYVGLGMLIAGAVLTPVGWVQFAHARKPHYESGPLGVAQRGAPKAKSEHRDATPGHVSFGLAPTRGGASAGVWGTF